MKGKRPTKADMIDSDNPYIGAIDSNNGVSAYISNNYGRKWVLDLMKYSIMYLPTLNDETPN